MRIVDELTGRVSSKEIPKKLDHLETKFKAAWAKGETRAVDVMLATNMPPVGGDGHRLALRGGSGHPKSARVCINSATARGPAVARVVSKPNPDPPGIPETPTPRRRQTTGKAGEVGPAAG